MAQMVPAARAMMGVPRKPKSSEAKPVTPTAFIMDEMAMRMMGTMMGAMALKPPGSLPYSATSSS